MPSGRTRDLIIGMGVVLLVGIAIVAGLGIIGSAGPSTSVLFGDSSEPTETGINVSDEEDRTPSTEAETSTPTLDSSLEEMETTLETDHGLSVTVTHTDDQRLEVEQVTSARTTGGYESEAELLTEAYATVLEAGHDIERMDVDVRLSDGGSTFLTWHVERSWVESYLEGEIDDAELIDRIQESIE